MGKVPTAVAASTEMKRKKKKGRPLKNPLPLSTPPKTSLSNSSNRRSTRRNPNQLNSPPRPDFDDDEDERKEKKVKLVVRLPQSDEKSKATEKNQKQQQSGRHSHDSDSGSDSGSGYDSDPDDEDREGPTKKRKIIGADGGSDDGGLDQVKEEVVKATDTPLQGSPLESGPTTLLPDKKLVVYILDRLQKKDTYGVFSEAVDPDELPDYFDIIKQPMDFGTVRKKLDNGSYKYLEELEGDVFLICSNAMQYNASDTVYYRQARTIQELAKRDFKNLKHEGDDGVPQPKIVRRGRPPSSKNQKKPLETSPVDRVGTDLSSGATLANGEDKATGSNSYNLRKGSTLFRYRSTDPFVSPYNSRNGENHSEYSTDWNNEFPASILRADMKYGKKQFTVDENKRDTYRLYDPLSLGDNSPILYHSTGNMKRLVPIGLQEALAYARSLARYAANLGPAAWKMASKKIEAVLPAGVQYGPGWVGENGVPSQPLPISIEKQKSSGGDYSSSKLATPSTCGLNSSGAHGPSEGMVEAVRKLNSQNELAGQGDASSWRTQLPPQQNHVHQSHRNGFSGMFGYGLSAAGTTRVSMPEHSVAEQKAEIASPNERPSSHSSAMNQVTPEQTKLPESSNALPPGYQMAQVKPSNSLGEVETRGSSVKSSWQGLAAQQRHNIAVPPDLNVRVPVGSPGSSLQIGSPQQPDLALQL
ncbi:DNA-binding bromodomain-containing protein [Perilla frutescens var. hirtella]|uniref:DNA-binding bromodomain-containing protein n=1 Tax=Perilla frutescens var. hirtella TaxID=608512 RepID=A0AAD4JJC3_PERFH|nr:DNA-binding bromodomain-containing protein [Perilla frutescens var. hirtella]